MVTRAERVTTTRQQQEVYYSDFLQNLDKHPSTGLMFRVVNENAIKQSIKNLVLTNLGERFFQPTVGGNINHFLFEPISGFTSDSIKDAVATTIFNNEPRIEKLAVEVEAQEDLNQYKIKINFKIRNVQTPASTELILKRNR